MAARVAFDHIDAHGAVRRLWRKGAALMLTMSTSIASAVILLAGSTFAIATEELSGDSLVIEAKVPISGNWLEYGFDSAWTTFGLKLVRINAGDNSFEQIDIGGSGDFRPPVAAGGALWVPDVALGKILKVDPATNKVVLEVPAEMLYSQSKLAFGDGAIWVVTAGGMEKTLSRFNADTGAVEAEIPLPSVVAHVEFAFGSVWVAGTGAGAVYRIDPATNAIADTITVHTKPQQLCSDETSLWVLNTGDGFVDRIDGTSGKLAASIDAGLVIAHDGDLACGGGYVWGHVAQAASGDTVIESIPVAQIDPATNTVLRKYIGGKGFGWDLRYGGGSLWMTGSSVFRVKPPQ